MYINTNCLSVCVCPSINFKIYMPNEVFIDLKITYSRFTKIYCVTLCSRSVVDDFVVLVEVFREK